MERTMKKFLIVLGTLAALSGAGVAASAGMGWIEFRSTALASNPCRTGHACFYPGTDGKPHAVGSDGTELGAWGVSGGGALPSLSGNANKYLFTDGATASWQTAQSLPSQTSNAGKYLTTDGVNASWAAVSAAVQISPSLIDAVVAGQLVGQDTASNNSTGESWLVTKNAVTLWDCPGNTPGNAMSGCSALATATGSVGGSSVASISFSSTVSLTAYRYYATTQYDQSLGHITQTVGSLARQSAFYGGGAVVNSGGCIPSGPYFEFCRSDIYGAGGGTGGAPVNTGGNGFYAEPIFTVP